MATIKNAYRKMNGKKQSEGAAAGIGFENMGQKKTDAIRFIHKESFTHRQYNYLQTLKTYETIRDIRVLRKLAKLGVVTLHEHTGHMVRCFFDFLLIQAFYVESMEHFEVEGIGIFKDEYFDGCFNPFIIRV